MNEELITFIIKELGKPRDRKAIIRNVCVKSGLNWKAAEQYVTLIEVQHRRKLASRRTPILLFLSIVILLVGIGLLGFNIQALITFVQQNMPGQEANLQSNHFHWTALLAGVAMTFTGLIGLWKAYGILFSE